MKLIDLYLDEIRRQLPPKNREDILKEIRSTLMDMIEDRTPDPTQTPDEQTIKTVLKEFGSPREVAAQYGAKNYLIGPRLFSTYLQVLRVVLIIIAAFNILGIVVTIIRQPNIDAGLIDTIAEVVGGLFSSLFTAFGIVTLSFAGIERTTPEEWHVEIDKEWTPDQLINHENVQRVSYTGLAFEITLTLIFIALINFFLDRIGIYYIGDSGWVSAPILNDNFLRYVPWITAYSVFDIGLNLYLIRTGFWDKWATLVKVFINAFKIAVNFAIILGPAVITVTANAWENLGFNLGFTAQELTRCMNIGLDVILGLAIFGLVVETIKLIYRNFIKGSSASIEIHPE
jgi:hypothetical protein